MSVAVLLPCQNERHLLWRSLASIAAQTAPPLQVLVLDRGSTDGLADWLRVRWPGIERRAIPSDADPAAIGAAIAAAIAAPAVAILRPGEHWPSTHLEALQSREDGAPSALVPTASLTTPAGAAELPWPLADTPSSAEALEDRDRLPAARPRDCPARPARRRLAPRATGSAGLRNAARPDPDSARDEPHRPSLASSGGDACGRAAPGQPLRRAGAGLCRRTVVHRGAAAPGREPAGAAGSGRRLRHLAGAAVTPARCGSEPSGCRALGLRLGQSAVRSLADRRSPRAPRRTALCSPCRRSCAS